MRVAAAPIGRIGCDGQSPQLQHIRRRIRSGPDGHGGSRGTVRRSLDPSAGGQPPAAGLLPCCGPARVLASAPPFANTRAQVAHCRLPQNDRDRSRGWLGERRPTQQVWIPVSSPRGHIRHSLRLPAILKYNVNEHFHIPSTGSCNIVSARLAGRSTFRHVGSPMSPHEEIFAACAGAAASRWRARS
jgi:hypothetical protein